MAEPILTLSTINPDRKFLTIDDVKYFLAEPDDFGLRELARLRRLGAEFDEFNGRDVTGFDEEETARYMSTIEAFVPLILPGAPADVVDSIQDNDKMRIVSAFIRESGIAIPDSATQPTAEPGRATRRSRIGAK